MPDLVSVDVNHLRTTSRECRELATELHGRIRAFEEQAATTRGAYGETPNASEAEREYRATTQDTVERLEKMHRDLVTTAQSLEEQARMYSDADRETTLEATELQKAF
ncbi:hypothetical protein SK854_45710 [Lentzea sp. BCCO 10_0061]|uniref:Excreted virulence factor EspC, type VII ESX diderm n=1 Tax=Lentzea sokolovensis TaxID=3095429 RepID=A0ABU4VCG4_9PSEU|nr:hypothetical protein [Lentzea sp. BCCO 10_0061]MDX8149488.1 hypothetical protein [Lentzea sp. BCCO 10_0061]